MGLRRWLARPAVQAPHALVVEAPGAWRIRVAVEQELRRRSWSTSTAPADADVLLICGSPPDSYGEAVERVWDQLPGPRALVTVDDGEAASVAAALDAAVDQLRDGAAQRSDAEARPAAPPQPDAEHHGHDDEGHGGHHEDNGGHGASGHHDDMEAAPGPHEDMDDSQMGHGHMDHAHGHMDMAGPGGIALAAGGPDRDGLEMDVLHLRLGPVLACWPAGMVLDLSLQGDVATAAEIELEGGLGDVEEEDYLTSAAQRCDAAASVLMLAGLPGSAERARRIRDLLLAGDGANAIAALNGLRRRVGASRTLRWSLRGLAPVNGRDTRGDDDPLRGDVYDRLIRMLDLATAETRLADRAPGPDFGELSDRLPGLLVGAELATVRLTVASVCGLASGASVRAAGGADG